MQKLRAIVNYLLLICVHKKRPQNFLCAKSLYGNNFDGIEHLWFRPAREVCELKFQKLHPQINPLQHTFPHSYVQSESYKEFNNLIESTTFPKCMRTKGHIFNAVWDLLSFWHWFLNTKNQMINLVYSHYPAQNQIMLIKINQSNNVKYICLLNSTCNDNAFFILISIVDLTITINNTN